MSEFINDLVNEKERKDMLYVVSIYKDIDLYHQYPISNKSILSTFKKTNSKQELLENMRPFYLYFMIAVKMIESGYQGLDPISVDEFINTKMSESIKLKYNTIGGYSFINQYLEHVNENNIAKYYDDVLKYDSLCKLYANGFDIERYWTKIQPMNYRELSDYVNGKYSEIFAGVELGSDEIVDIKKGLDEMIERANLGALNGIPYASDLLNHHTHGMRRGEMTILAAKSGQGKTFLTTMLVLPELIKNKEPVLIMCNEEDIEKWQRELLVYIMHNIIIPNEENFKGYEFKKGRFFEGNFQKKDWELLNRAKEIMTEWIEDGFVLFVNLTTFSMDKAIDIIKQYSSKFSIKYYILDTLKLDNNVGSGSYGEQAWLQLQQSSVKLYNTIKKNNRDSFIILTYQLNKQNVKKLSMESLGMSKNIVDVASTVILARNVMNEEKGSEKSKLIVKDLSHTQLTLDEFTEYMVITIEKNRAGSSGVEFVLETDKARNIVKDIGMTVVPNDR